MLNVRVKDPGGSKDLSEKPLAAGVQSNIIGTPPIPLVATSSKTDLTTKPRRNPPRAAKQAVVALQPTRLARRRSPASER